MNRTLWMAVICGLAVALAGWPQTLPMDPPCVGYEAWGMQSNVRSDTTGKLNINYPEGNATYWVTLLTAPLKSVVILKGRYPKARYMAFQLYDQDRNVVDAIKDKTIQPDPGQNNPFVTGTEQGAYTVRIVFGRKPAQPAGNTIYTNGLTSVLLIYRIYHPNNPDDLTGGTWNPQLPSIELGGRVLTTCPPRPIVVPEDLTVWGRLDNGDWNGTPASSSVGQNPPNWQLSVTNKLTPYFPNADNAYMSAVISREFLKAPHYFDMVVLRFRAPTFPNTQAGERPYADRQVRFWSVCQNERLSTGVVRCVPDNLAAAKNGFVTFVISDPSKQPAKEVLAQHGASWLAWGALQPGDVIYDDFGNPLTNNDPVYYHGLILYRQTVAKSTFTQSMVNVGKLSRWQWKAAMGDYWPQIGYCTAASFQALGAGCIGK